MKDNSCNSQAVGYHSNHESKSNYEKPQRNTCDTQEPLSNPTRETEKVVCAVREHEVLKELEASTKLFLDNANDPAAISRLRWAMEKIELFRS